jgi:type I restriction enzyme R subunit
MPRRRQPPELIFQQHIASFLVREHGYGVLEQANITNTDQSIAEDQLWAFLQATQTETLKKLTDDYGTDAREEVFRALRSELAHTPLWMLLRHGLKVRGLDFRLYYPRPRSAVSAAAGKYGENRIPFRPHFYYGETNQEIDFVFFLNGLPIVALEVKHERNQTVHDAVAQFAARDHARRIFQHPFLYLAADTSDVMAATDPRLRHQPILTGGRCFVPGELGGKWLPRPNKWAVGCPMGSALRKAANSVWRRSWRAQPHLG